MIYISPPYLNINTIVTKDCSTKYMSPANI